MGTQFSPSQGIWTGILFWPNYSIPPAAGEGNQSVSESSTANPAWRASCWKGVRRQFSTSSAVKRCSHRMLSPQQHSPWRPGLQGIKQRSKSPKPGVPAPRLDLCPCVSAAFPSCLGVMDKSNYLLCLETNTRGWWCILGNIFYPFLR